MDETAAVIKQLVDEGRGTLLRVGEREYYRYGTDTRWFAQPSGQPVDEAMADLLDALVSGSTVQELSPEEPKPLDVDDVYDDLVEHLQHDHDAQVEELGHQPTEAERSKLCPEELALQLYSRSDSVATAAVAEALQRPYLNYGSVQSVFGGTQECC